MYYCVENTFITTKWRTLSARRSVSLPALLERTAEPDTDDQIDTLEERASALIADFEARKRSKACAEAQESLPPPYPPLKRALCEPGQAAAPPFAQPQ